MDFNFSPSGFKMRQNVRKKPHCSFCKNHKQKSSTRQHNCPFKDKCKCILCELTHKAQVIMCHQQRVWRFQNQRLSNEPFVKGQKCDNCRNHSKYIKKSNHDCPFKTCDCRLCKLTFNRRIIMKYIQRARRLEVTLESEVKNASNEAQMERESLTQDVNSLFSSTDKILGEVESSRSSSKVPQKSSRAEEIAEFHKQFQQTLRANQALQEPPNLLPLNLDRQFQPSQADLDECGASGTSNDGGSNSCWNRSVTVRDVKPFEPARTSPGKKVKLEQVQFNVENPPSMFNYPMGAYQGGLGSPQNDLPTLQTMLRRVPVTLDQQAVGSPQNDLPTLQTMLRGVPVTLDQPTLTFPFLPYAPGGLFNQRPEEMDVAASLLNRARYYDFSRMLSSVMDFNKL